MGLKVSLLVTSFLTGPVLACDGRQIGIASEEIAATILAEVYTTETGTATCVVMTDDDWEIRIDE